MDHVETGADAATVERVAATIGIDPPANFGLLIAEALPDLRNLIRVNADALHASKPLGSEAAERADVDVGGARP